MGSLGGWSKDRNSALYRFLRLILVHDKVRVVLVAVCY